MAKRTDQFQTIRTEGALLPPDILQMIASLKVDGVSAGSYHLPPGSKLNEAIAHSWSVLQKFWRGFQDVRQQLSEDQTGTEITNQHWSLPLFEELRYGRLTTVKAPEIDGRTYPVERFYADQPIHLIGCNLQLDRRTAGARGAATATPHSMMQEFLNRTEQSLWGILSNGRVLRILRDNVSLSRQAYIEFNLEAMMDGEVYADFALLWMLCHQSRIEADKPQDSWLEKWSQLAREQGTRVLSHLRSGVARAIEALGRGFLAHPRNDRLRERLQSGQLDTQEYYRQLLRIVYRLLFLFVAEDRGLLHPPAAHADACELYDTYYSTRRLRELADQIRGSKHADLWHTLSLVFNALGLDEGCPQLGLPGLGSFLWQHSATSDLLGPSSKDTGPVENLALIRNDDLLTAVRALAYVVQDKVRRAVDYRNLGSEELGSVYESLLELHPLLNVPARTFELSIAAGNERKTTGSYYTPDSLVQCLLDSALDPVVDDRLEDAKRLARGQWNSNEEKQKALAVVKQELPLPAGERGEAPQTVPAIAAETQPAFEIAATKQWDKTPFPIRHSLLAQQALLALKVCDPACGSGHFLIAAAHRMARHLARVRTGETEPSPEDYQHALRDIIGRCVYGVDVNPMAVELCKVSLWMEALEPGRPLSFLDHHIQCGNSLLGTTPALLKQGIPDDAFKPIEGDVKAMCSELKKDNKRERQDHESGQGYLFDTPYKLGNLPASFARLSSDVDDSVADVAEKERRYARLVSGADYLNARLLADTWCALFVWQKDTSDLGKLCPTERDFRKIENNPHSILPHVKSEVRRLADQYQFFHWHLAFPDVFRLPEEGKKAENEQTGWNDGFDVALGNPPWEKMQFEERQFIESKGITLKTTSAAERKKFLANERKSDSTLYRDLCVAREHLARESAVITQSHLFPLCGKGKFNKYAVFFERALSLIGHDGRLGQIVKSGLATDFETKEVFFHLIEKQRLISLIDFENKESLFPGVAPPERFCLITAGGMHSEATPRFVFNLTNVAQLNDAGRAYSLSQANIESINPNTKNCPVFRTSRDATLTAHVYSRYPVIDNESRDDNPFQTRFKQQFNVTDDAHLFQNETELLYERGAKRDGQLFILDGTDYLPLNEPKFFQLFDHRFGTFDGVPDAEKLGRKASTRRPELQEKQSADFVAEPRYWVPRDEFDSKRDVEWNREYYFVYRGITNISTNARTAIGTVIPAWPLSKASPAILFEGDDVARSMCLFSASFSSFAFDYVCRQKIGGPNLNIFIVKQLPVIPRESVITSCCLSELQVVARILELTYTAWDLEAFALDCGYSGPPFRWDEERRFLLRCELDAAYFQLYLGEESQWGIGNRQVGNSRDSSPIPDSLLPNSSLLEMFPTPRDAVDYIMETFPIVKRKDERAHGEYRTKRVILEIYDEMAQAIETGQPYQTRLDPPPGPPTDAEGNFIPMAEWDQSNWPSHIHLPKTSEDLNG